MSILSNLVISGGVTFASGPLSVGSSLYVSNRLAASGGLTAASAGLDVTGGMTLSSGGIAATSGSLSVSNSVASVVLSGGMTISQGPSQLHSAKGITIFTGGVSCQGSMTVAASNANINGGATVSGGVT